MKKVVVLGAKGMAGHIMAEYLDAKDEYEVYGVAREGGGFVSVCIDVLDFKALEQSLSELQPDVVINCIGVLVDNARDNLSNAILINSYLPNLLAELGRNLGYMLVHISTDCVFSGKSGQYSEESFRDGDDNYARTKALGEVFDPEHLTIRTSIIGPELKENGTGLLDWFLKQEAAIGGYTQAFWSGVTTLELAKATDEFIRQDVRGLYQLCPEAKIAKYDLLKKFSEIWGRPIEINPVDNYVVDKSLVCTRNDFDYPRPEYDQMLLETKQWMDERPGYYTHYKSV